jgi:hypothetical protein
VPRQHADVAPPPAAACRGAAAPGRGSKCSARMLPARPSLPAGRPPCRAWLAGDSL